MVVVQSHQTRRRYAQLADIAMRHRASSDAKLHHSSVLQESKGSHHESKDFKAAVARTRQAVSVQKAIGFMDASSPAKYVPCMLMSQLLLVNHTALSC